MVIGRNEAMMNMLSAVDVGEGVRRIDHKVSKGCRQPICLSDVPIIQFACTPNIEAA